MRLCLNSCGRAEKRKNDYYDNSPEESVTKSVDTYLNNLNRYPQDPNPQIFTIASKEIVNNNTLLLVHYPNCTTFNGLKLLLIQGLEYDEKFLDPHLLGNNHPVIARFEPNGQGWRIARICAENL